MGGLFDKTNAVVHAHWTTALAVQINALRWIPVNNRIRQQVIL